MDAVESRTCGARRIHSGRIPPSDGPKCPTQAREALREWLRGRRIQDGELHWGQIGRIFAHGLRRAFVMPSRAVAGGLNVEAVVHAIDDDLRLALRLHVAAHDTEGHPGFSIFAGEAGDDGLERAFAGRVNVGMTVLQRKEFAAILEHETESISDESRAHTAEVGLDLRNHHAGGVGDSEIGGVTMAGSFAGMNGRKDFVGANEFGTFGGVGF